MEIKVSNTLKSFFLVEIMPSIKNLNGKEIINDKINNFVM